ncbi:hypothetical protein CFR76_14810 [Komagataeibacter swingsii]|uniref:Uncharacterized protein n=1 Tax=Komagataeibacter swingsii TaxID=215220 RepID=A0A2V4QVD5_9PROT|nr:hypothetical protein CFR76_14810 [Komagataeibacter swingsii]
MLHGLPPCAPAGTMRGGATPAGAVRQAPAPAMAGAGMVLTRADHAVGMAAGVRPLSPAAPPRRARAAS